MLAVWVVAGLDIEMPQGKFFTEEKIMAAIAAKNVTVDQLHDSCVRIMSGWYVHGSEGAKPNHTVGLSRNRSSGRCCPRSLDP